MTDLDRLIEAVEDGEGETLPWRQVFGWDDTLNADAAHKGSLDAALSLMEALLPGWEWGRMPSTCCMYVSHPGDPIRMRHQEFMADPTRALLLAVLKAYRETRG